MTNSGALGNIGKCRDCSPKPCLPELIGRNLELGPYETRNIQINPFLPNPKLEAQYGDIYENYETWTKEVLFQINSIYFGIERSISRHW